jgi:hypothetical protein
VQIAVDVEVPFLVPDGSVKRGETGIGQEDDHHGLVSKLGATGVDGAQPFGAESDQDQEGRHQLEDQAPVERVSLQRRGNQGQQDRTHHDAPRRPGTPRERNAASQ